MNNRDLEDKVLDEKINAKVEAHRILKKDNKTKEDYLEAVQNYIKSGTLESDAYEIIGRYASHQDIEIGIELLKKSNTCISLCQAGDLYDTRLKDANSAAEMYELAISKANGNKPIVIEKAIRFYIKAKNTGKIDEIKKKYKIDTDYSKVFES